MNLSRPVIAAGGTQGYPVALYIGSASVLAPEGEHHAPVARP